MQRARGGAGIENGPVSKNGPVSASFRNGPNLGMAGHNSAAPAWFIVHKQGHDTWLAPQRGTG